MHIQSRYIPAKFHPDRTTEPYRLSWRRSLQQEEAQKAQGQKQDEYGSILDQYLTENMQKTNVLLIY